MRYAVVSDIHANPEALRNVLADAQDCGCEKLICLGDVVGYGPDPVGALELVYKRCHVCLAGNHDDAVCGRRPYDDFSEFAAAAIDRQREELTDVALGWLRERPYTFALGDFVCAHGDHSLPSDFRYVIDDDDAIRSFAGEREHAIQFVGHSHEPCIFVANSEGAVRKLEPVDFLVEPGKRYIVNPGSVGYPRAGAGRSSYVIWDDEARVITFRSIPFDLEGYREKMGGRGLDEAPWMRDRAEARARPDLRASAKFGRAALPWRRLAAGGGIAAVLVAFAVAAALFMGDDSTGGESAAAWPSLWTREFFVAEKDGNVNFSLRPAADSPPMRMHVTFVDGNGKTIDERYYAIKGKSVFKRTPKVPNNAERATIRLECENPAAIAPEVKFGIGK